MESVYTLCKLCMWSTWNIFTVPISLSEYGNEGSMCRVYELCDLVRDGIIVACVFSVCVVWLPCTGGAPYSAVGSLSAIPTRVVLFMLVYGRVYIVESAVVR